MVGLARQTYRRELLVSQGTQSLHFFRVVHAPARSKTPTLVRLNALNQLPLRHILYVWLKRKRKRRNLRVMG